MSVEGNGVGMKTQRCVGWNQLEAVTLAENMDELEKAEVTSKGYPTVNWGDPTQA